MREEHPELPAKSFDELMKLVTKLVEENPDHINRPIGISRSGAIDATHMAELMNQQPPLSLSETKVGDVVWWKTSDEKTTII